MDTPSEPVENRLDVGLDAIMRERSHLLNLAYRLLGSLTEAEDAVQETYARWLAMSPQQRQDIAAPGAWLTAVAGRICLDLLRSARVRRERYVGEWVPEPLPGRSDWISAHTGSSTADPADRISLDESINMAFLVILESMTPAERVSFVLHDVFRYSFAEVAEVVGRSPAACRQLASSARRRLRAPRLPATPAAVRTGLVGDFKRAWESGDINALVELLDPEATATADGGGLATAEPHPVETSDRIARVFADIVRRAPQLRISETTVNGQPGLVAWQQGVLVVVVAFETVGSRITRIWAVRNPEKLRLWTAD